MSKRSSLLSSEDDDRTLPPTVIPDNNSQYPNQSKSPSTGSQRRNQGWENEKYSSNTSAIQNQSAAKPEQPPQGPLFSPYFRYQDEELDHYQDARGFRSDHNEYKKPNKSSRQEELSSSDEDSTEMEELRLSFEDSAANVTMIPVPTSSRASEPNKSTRKPKKQPFKCKKINLRCIFNWLVAHKISVAWIGFFILMWVSIILLLAFVWKWGRDKPAEVIFLSSFNGTRIMENVQQFSSFAHLAGTPGSLKMARLIRDKLIDAGLANAKIESYEVLLTYPEQRSLSLIYPDYFEASLDEGNINIGQKVNESEIVPTYNAYSGEGNVTAPLVYVNYGTIEDFDLLSSLGIQVNNCIVIARNGKTFRGNIAREAEIRGAAGLLLFSDPADFGSSRGPVFPNGPWAPNVTVQRGSIFTGQGDPLTPNWASRPYAPRISLESAYSFETWGSNSLTSIPVQPISADDAKPLLQSIFGMSAPEGWQGGIDGVNYEVGVGPGIANLHVKLNYSSLTPIYNVLASIPGDSEADKIVMMGGHHDAWVFGAGDPGSAMAALVEAAYAFGKAMAKGWKPSRTIYLVAWDAEEFGMIGSTEFTEAHAPLLNDNMVAYINLDHVRPGQIPRLDICAPPSLGNLLINASYQVPLDTDYGDTLYDFWKISSLDLLDPSDVKNMTKSQKDSFKPFTVPVPSASDQSPFYHTLGISSVYFRWKDKNNSDDAVYHSKYDSYLWWSKFSDPMAKYTTAAGQFWGLLAMKLASEAVIGMNYYPYGKDMNATIFEIEANLNKTLNQLNGTESIEDFDFTSIKNEIKRFIDIAQKTEVSRKNYTSMWATTSSATPSLIHSTTTFNNRIMRVERAFLDSSGLDSRDWIRHVIYAPSLYNSYEGETFPRLVDAIRNKNWDLTKFQLGYLALFIRAASESLSGSLM